MKPMRTLLLLGPLTLLAASSALAAPVVTATVPFPFTVRDQVFPPGEYRVERDGEHPGVLIVRGCLPCRL